ncbi:transmembrane protein 126A isoform X2 [Photinus pyralis]|uniref:transmembrane protein 126A isoform X2 n=1 Tax=Photinus pyralis TaxID=7054 RepID=UPI0012672EBA|nr:transmembrane protein 126A isoform X2 [Photinus pyralis]
MALLKAKPENIPEDAVILTREKALQYQLDILKNWKHQSDIWPIKHGGTILASLSALSGIYINNYYRFKFKLLNYGRLSSYLPLCGLPAIMSFMSHTQFVLPDVVLQENCAVCTQMRASALQSGFGAVFPLLLAPMSIFSVRYNTYDIPYFTKEPLKAAQLWLNKTKPINNILFAIFVGQALAATAVTYLEANAIEKVNDKLTLLGYDLDNDY